MHNFLAQLKPPVKHLDQSRPMSPSIKTDRATKLTNAEDHQSPNVSKLVKHKNSQELHAFLNQDLNGSDQVLRHTRERFRQEAKRCESPNEFVNRLSRTSQRIKRLAISPESAKMCASFFDKLDEAVSSVIERPLRFKKPPSDTPVEEIKSINVFPKLLERSITPAPYLNISISNNSDLVREQPIITEKLKQPSEVKQTYSENIEEEHLEFSSSSPLLKSSQLFLRKNVSIPIEQRSEQSSFAQSPLHRDAGGVTDSSILERSHFSEIVEYNAGEPNIKTPKEPVKHEQKQKPKLKPTPMDRLKGQIKTVAGNSSYLEMFGHHKLTKTSPQRTQPLDRSHPDYGRKQAEKIEKASIEDRARHYQARLYGPHYVTHISIRRFILKSNRKGS